jgi:hypothetical protein
MSIFNRRNALVGWVALRIGRRYLARRARAILS